MKETAQAKIKRLESELAEIKSQLAKAEKRNAMFDQYLEDETPFLKEFKRLMHFLIEFVKTSNESKKLLTKKDRQALKQHDPKITRAIFDGITQNPIAKNDRQKNEALYKSIGEGNEVTRIRNLMPHLENALHLINSLKPKPERKRLKPKQKVFFQWVEDYNIDVRQALDALVLAADDDYDSGHLKIKLGRSTIRECLKQAREQARKNKSKD